MSYMWSIYSYDFIKFEEVLKHKREKFVFGVLAEMAEFGDPPAEIEPYKRIGAFIVENGFTYAGHSKADAKIIDRFAFDLFHHCGQDIDKEGESYEFLSPRSTAEFPSNFRKKFFWSKRQPIPKNEREYFILPLFEACGRRLGETDGSHCEYLALNHEETAQLKNELEKFLAIPDGKEANEFCDRDIEENLLVPTQEILNKGKCLQAQLS